MSREQSPTSQESPSISLHSTLNRVEIRPSSNSAVRRHATVKTNVVNHHARGLSTEDHEEEVKLPQVVANSPLTTPLSEHEDSVDEFRINSTSSRMIGGGDPEIMVHQTVTPKDVSAHNTTRPSRAEAAQLRHRSPKPQDDAKSDIDAASVITYNSNDVLQFPTSTAALDEVRKLQERLSAKRQFGSSNIPESFEIHGQSMPMTKTTFTAQTGNSAISSTHYKPARAKHMPPPEQITAKKDCLKVLFVTVFTLAFLAVAAVLIFVFLFGGSLSPKAVGTKTISNSGQENESPAPSFIPSTPAPTLASGVVTTSSPSASPTLTPTAAPTLSPTPAPTAIYTPSPEAPAYTKPTCWLDTSASFYNIGPLNGVLCIQRLDSTGKTIILPSSTETSFQLDLPPTGNIFQVGVYSNYIDASGVQTCNNLVDTVTCWG